MAIVCEFGFCLSSFFFFSFLLIRDRTVATRVGHKRTTNTHVRTHGQVDHSFIFSFTVYVSHISFCFVIESFENRSILVQNKLKKLRKFDLKKNSSFEQILR